MARKVHQLAADAAEDIARLLIQQARMGDVEAAAEVLRLALDRPRPDGAPAG